MENLTKVVRSVIGSKTGMYNDKRANNRRSIKVCGWTTSGVYLSLQRVLEQAGYTVELHTTRIPITVWRGGPRTQTRLLVSK